MLAAVRVAAVEGPRVRGGTIELTLADPKRDFSHVALLHELRRPRRIPYARDRRMWRLRFPLPNADRMEYLLELTRRDRGTQVVPDPTNPLRAAGPFGEKSVVELPDYEPPRWTSDDESPPGELRPLPLWSPRLRATLDAFVWSPADTDPAEPLPFLLAHDGLEYAQYSDLLRLLDHLVAFGHVPRARAVLVPPVHRNETYSASARYSRALVGEFLPALHAALPVPRERRPIALGASLGALALLHAHWSHAGRFDGLFLQSGSYFRQRSDRQEARFPRFGRIARFVGRVLAGRGDPDRVPLTLTCGTAEENLDNNRAVAVALAAHGFDVRFVEHRDAHNWISWRDALDPHLADLLVRSWT
jgi:enterochelin esterase-like enzyme